MVLGSVNAAMVLGQKDWNPGIMYNDNHNFENYIKVFGSNLLNSDGIIKEFKIMDGPKDFKFFARPTRDTKIFESKTFTDICNETKVLVSTPKDNIQQEIRCWIVDGEPVTMSQYKIGRRVNMLNMDNNQESYIFAKKMAKLFSPSRAYVLDICLYEDDYKIVEINCMNMSGFYDANMSKLIQSLEKTFNHG